MKSGTLSEAQLKAEDLLQRLTKVNLDLATSTTSAASASVLERSSIASILRWRSAFSARASGLCRSRASRLTSIDCALRRW